MKEKYLDFICSIGELSSLFIQSSTLDAFLQRTVDIVAKHMSVDVCSIYLWSQEDDLLVLQATRGLSGDSVGRVKLESGEGDCRSGHERAAAHPRGRQQQPPQLQIHTRDR